MQTKHYVWLAAVVGIVVGVGGWLLFAPKAAVAPTSSTDLGNGVQIQATGSTTVTEGDGQAAPKPPALRAINFSAGTSADLKVALQTQYNTYVAQLKVTPTRIDSWLQLGVLYKIGGDYPGTIGAWTYVSEAGSSPNNYVAYGDLGDLYLNFTHEYAKAEASFKAALALQPTNADYTAGLKAAQKAQGK
jgi:tetratricopeptide (TPR) repeat protein